MRNSWGSWASCCLRHRELTWPLGAVFQSLKPGRGNAAGAKLFVSDQWKNNRPQCCSSNTNSGQIEEEKEHTEWSSIGTGYPESLGNTDPWRFSTGQGPERPSISSGLALLWPGCWTRWPPEVPFNQDYFIFKWQVVTRAKAKKTKQKSASQHHVQSLQDPTPH